MVLFHANAHIFQNDFNSVTSVVFNKYPNPYANHVLSVDTIDRKVDENGNLLTTRLIRKKGKLPKWIEYIVGSRITESWMIEFTMVDPKKKIMKSFNRNIDHVRLLQVEEYTTYQYDEIPKHTVVNSKVKFTSGFHVGIRSKIEKMSLSRFESGVEKSRLGMALVMKRVEEQRKRTSLQDII
ncbi:similar to Saccharomyces cerevisiae YLR193C UPS1 Mitochondrial intermembrane space protein that regulates mitochondrial cardiolipin levels [Maudiozyma barnettii]|uniref:Similar to Saccharomyces cerevisiae YLR193C UPS1 Mitochondrial intermembrane space protein that regulates mitochondrial cardiolipin levels n=1 Tax=Maudiozyma barnettii TaxID=61262 RepID=A0A8H2VE04_9SACH|nr:Ups1p [Kazachstania barnettii]CAB4253815.1 similar to Saccharomyces cerevisiae YLR193C UPS1 Mitochondrial intermembrane space protein that regulates mitochondrial cardiolipin levels [Kazachstania barnettii]CAD1781564.1 similar to Saccharomyces cerevisiae YLR193C UPS1 Mitochondrial intermembrane space protein that regulates mitochondrial cardiolipin levels [Kazachstania barnettii]